MITGIKSLKGIRINGIGNIDGININSGGHSSRGRRVSIIRKYGGKYKQVPIINRYIKEIASANKCHTFVELTGGGGRIILNLPIFEVDGNIYEFNKKIYNEYDRGLCNMFKCVKDPVLVEKLMELLLRLGRNEEIFNYAKEHKSKEDTSELLSAALTYITAMQSWSGNATNFIRGKQGKYSAEELEKQYVRGVKQLPKKTKTLKNIKIINGDYKPLLEKYGADPKVLKYIDPPYHPITRNQNGLDIYDLEWSIDDHKKLVKQLLKSRSWILSGYDPLVWGCEDYLPLEKAGAKKVNLGVFRNGTNSTETSKFNKEEYLWIMK